MNSPQSDAMQRCAALPRCDRTGAWNALKNHYGTHGRGFDLRDAFARHADRFEAMSVQATEVYADLSKNLLDPATLQLLLDLARECADLLPRLATGDLDGLDASTPGLIRRLRSA